MCSTKFLIVFFISCLASVLLGGAATAEDVVEFMSGAKLNGDVTRIDKAGRKVTLRAKVGSRTTERVFSYSQIHAIVYRGKRYVLTPKQAGPAAGPQKRIPRTRQEVLKLIEEVGSTDPSWLDETRLVLPRTLNLKWPDPPKGKWQNQIYPGQYVWDNINPNPGRWREGVKLMHHLVEVNRNNPQARLKAMNQLGTLYASLLEDWPRAAYWWMKAGKGTQGGMGAGGFRVGIDNGLAKCYWKLGNKDMAVERLSKARNASCYMWAEIGEYDRALKQAERDRNTWMKDQALIRCGDVCRQAGWFDKAMDYYQKASNLPSNDKYKRTVLLAKDRIAALKATQAIDLSKLADGSYNGSSMGYSGMLYVRAQVKGGRIESVAVTSHKEKQYYSSLTDIPRQVIAKQSVKGVDATASATITSEAILAATAKALAK